MEEKVGKLIVIPYLDDIIVWGENEVEHLENIRIVFQRLEEQCLKIKLRGKVC